MASNNLSDELMHFKYVKAHRGLGGGPDLFYLKFSNRPRNLETFTKELEEAFQGNFAILINAPEGEGIGITLMNGTAYDYLNETHFNEIKPLEKKIVEFCKGYNLTPL